MSEVSTKRGASWVAIASLIFGAIALLSFFVWNPILQWVGGSVSVALAIVLQLGPGLLAVALGIIAVRPARRGRGDGQELASLGMLCAVIGNLPTIIAVLAMTIAGVQGYLQDVGRFRFKDGTVHLTLSILPVISDDDFVEEVVGGVKARTLKFPRDSDVYTVEAKTYYINADGKKSDLQGMYSMKLLEKGKSLMAAMPKRVAWKSTETGLIEYEGVLQQLRGKRLELIVGLENKVPCQFAVEGLREVRATKWFSTEEIREIIASEGNQAISLDEISLDQPLPPGTHTIRITGVAPL